MHEISNNLVYATSKGSDQPAQSDQSLCLSLEYSMTVELLTEHCLEFLSLTGGCTGSSESTLVKMSNCWKSHAAAHISSLSRTKMVYYSNVCPEIVKIVYFYMLKMFRKWKLYVHVFHIWGEPRMKF